MVAVCASSSLASDPRYREPSASNHCYSNDCFGSRRSSQLFLRCPRVCPARGKAKPPVTRGGPSVRAPLHATAGHLSVGLGSPLSVRFATTSNWQATWIHYGYGLHRSDAWMARPKHSLAAHLAAAGPKVLPAAAKWGPPPGPPLGAGRPIGAAPRPWLAALDASGPPPPRASASRSRSRAPRASSHGTRVPWRSAFSAFSDSPAQRPARQSPIRRWRGRQHLPESYDSGLASWTRVVRPAPPRIGRRRRRRRSPAHGRRRQRGCSDHAVRLGELLCSRARPSPACPALMSNRWGALPMYLPIEGGRTEGIY